MELAIDVAPHYHISMYMILTPYPAHLCLCASLVLMIMHMEIPIQYSSNLHYSLTTEMSSAGWLG